MEVSTFVWAKCPRPNASTTIARQKPNRRESEYRKRPGEHQRRTNLRNCQQQMERAKLFYNGGRHIRYENPFSRPTASATPLAGGELTTGFVTNLVSVSIHKAEIGG